MKKYILICTYFFHIINPINSHIWLQERLIQYISPFRAHLIKVVEIRTN